MDIYAYIFIFTFNIFIIMLSLKLRGLLYPALGVALNVYAIAEIGVNGIEYFNMKIDATVTAFILLMLTIIHVMLIMSNWRWE